jgi:hypothetical protein
LEARRDGVIKGVRVAASILISRLLFVDDNMIFAKGSLGEINHYKYLLDIFCKATRMEVNFRKSCMLFNRLEGEVERKISQALPLFSGSFDLGIKYLGFHLKPHDYKYLDWLWF